MEGRYRELGYMEDKILHPVMNYSVEKTIHPLMSYSIDKTLHPTISYITDTDTFLASLVYLLPLLYLVTFMNVSFTLKDLAFRAGSSPSANSTCAWWCLRKTDAEELLEVWGCIGRVVE